MATLYHYQAPHNTNFYPLFRLLDDFQNYSNAGSGTSRQHRVATSFQPKFDVRETEEAYELHGELAGIDRDHIEIEFTDPQNMTVRGRIERTYTAGTPPAGLVQGPDNQSLGFAGEGDLEKSGQKATVHDEGDTEDAGEARGSEVNTPVTTTVEAVDKKKTDTAKYWVSERSIGEFRRSFNFPQRVEQEAVKANLENGLLTVIVPKARNYVSRRIAIN